MKALTATDATIKLIDAVESSGVKLTLDGLGRVQHWMAAKAPMLADPDGPTTHRLLCRMVRQEAGDLIRRIAVDNEIDSAGIEELESKFWEGSSKYCERIGPADDPGPIDPD